MRIAKIAPDGNLTPRQRRRVLIEMSLRRQKPGTGSGENFMLKHTASNPWPDLRSILEGLEWVIVGGVATRAYMPERMTKDMDILVRQSDGPKAIERLRQAGYQTGSELALPGFMMVSPEGVEVDILFGKYPWLDEAFSNKQQDPAGYPVLALPYLILMKMDATRAQDWADITRMLGWAADDQLQQVRQIVAHYTPEDVEDIESLIFIGQKERQSPEEGN